MSTVAFIPVRIGSKSIPKKNIKPFCGKPLLLWTVEAALECQQIDKVVVASDSSEIDDALSRAASPRLTIYRRSSESATDTASTEMVMLEYLQRGETNPEDVFVLIQATSPFLKTEHLTQALKHFQKPEIDSMLSVVRLKRFFWSEDGESLNYDFRKRPRRQDFKGQLVENGAFYISRVNAILESENRLSGNIEVYEMPEYSFTEIDEPDDWSVAESMFRRNLVDTRSREIKLVISDVDGVLTDAGMYYSESGDELKKFNTRDGMGFQLLKEAGIKTGIITSEDTGLVERRAKKLKVDFLEQGKKHGGKLSAALEMARQVGCDITEVAYIGDDINCLELLSSVGFAACPADAVQEIKSIPGIAVLFTKGGEGVFREFVGKILVNK